MTRSVVAVVGNPRPGSRTAAVATALARRLAGAAEPEVLELAALAPRLFDRDAADVADAMARVAGADLLVVASPTYKATYTGLLKAFLDRFTGNALHGVPAVPVMLAAAPEHALAVEVSLRPLLVELGASLPTRGLFVQESRVAELDALLDTWCAANISLLQRPSQGA